MSAPRRKRALASVLAIAFGLGSCTVDQEPARYTEALEIPLEGRNDRIELVRILESAAQVSDELHVDDVSRRYAEYHDEVEIVPTDERPTVSISVWIGEDDDELVASVNDFGHRGRVWATFLKGKDVQLHSRFLKEAVRSIRKRWPEARSIPILPSGGIGNPEDFVIIDGNYRIDRAKATTYSLPYDSELLANRPSE